MFDTIHEECGVFGIFDPGKTLNVAKETYIALYALQHRGQESAGIAVNLEGKISVHKDVGLVNEVFNEMILNAFNGNIACGHVRYSMSPMLNRENAQPFVSKHTKGQIAIAMNGNIVNAGKLRDELSELGAMFQTTSDAELLTYIIGRERLRTDSTEQAIINVMDRIKGAYSLSIVTMNKLIAVRDPYGFRPLCYGRLGESYIIASESCAIDSLGGEFIRDIEPGEVLVIDMNGVHSHKDKCGKKTGFCIFEHIYVARPDSVIDGQNVHFSRLEAGRCLARDNKVEADIVIGVPDTGIDGAIGYSMESGIPYEVGLVRNRYIGRTFIQTTQSQRENSVRIKLNPLSSVIKGKKIILVDDSIVRGTSMKNLISIMRKAGAAEVHLRISSPPFINPCYFGTDIDSKDKLIACRLTLDEICKELKADSLAYLSIDSLPMLMKDSKYDYCTGCFTGVYPIDVKNL